MPNWLSSLTQPMVPKSAIAGLREALAPGSSYDFGATDGNDPEPDYDTDDWLSRIGEVPGALSDIASNIGSHPLETLGGAASGALEGMRGMTSPLDALSLVPMGGVLGAVAGKAAPAVERMAGPTLDILESSPVRQIKPGMQAVDDLIGQLGMNLKGVPQATGQMRRPQAAAQAAVNGLKGPRGMYPNMPAEFTPRGGEAVYNSVRKPGF